MNKSNLHYLHRDGHKLHYMYNDQTFIVHTTGELEVHHLLSNLLNGTDLPVEYVIGERVQSGSEIHIEYIDLIGKGILGKLSGREINKKVGGERNYTLAFWADLKP